LFRQRLDLGRHDGETTAGVAGAGRLDGGVQRQQIGLFGDRIDEFDHRADSWTWRPISVIDEAISSVEEATDCTLVEASSEAAATIVVSSWARSAVAVSVPAEASSSLDAEDTVSTILPTAPSKSSASLIISALRRCAATWSWLILVSASSRAFCSAFSR